MSDSEVPANPKIFHVTKVDNLPSIIAAGGLWSHAKCIERGVAVANIGNRGIKDKRMKRTVDTTQNGKLGEYVPFHFCCRSRFLYAIDRGHADYPGGQADVVHLVSSVERATSLGRAWAFSDRHPLPAYAQHFDDLRFLNEVRWDVMPLKYWSEVGEERDAEFLVKDFFAWEAIGAIGVLSDAVAARVCDLLAPLPTRATVAVRPQWYY